MASVATIRDALPITGKRILEVTTDDFEGQDFKGQRISRVYLHLEDGTTASFVIGGDDLAFSYDGFPDGHPFLEDIPGAVPENSEDACNEDDYDSD